MAAASKKLAAAAAAVVGLLALLVGPSVGQQGSGSGCFVGWTSLSDIPKSLICVLLGGPNFTPPIPKKDPPTGKGLTYGYYSNPNNKDSYCSEDVEAAVRRVVKAAVEKNTTIYQVQDPREQGRGVGAGLIRLFFHDAFVRGCDASVLLESTAAAGSNTEMQGAPNQNSLRGFKVIDAAKKATKDACGGRNVVSCADILAFAARDASYLLSGGKIDFPMPAGRLDGRESFAGETNTLPGPDSSFQQLVKMFELQGLNATDLVTLSAAHSIGDARCLFSKARRDANSNAMDSDYAAQLRAECGSSDDTRVPQDPFSPSGPGLDPYNTLDNQYYKNIKYNKVLFNSDAVLVSDDTAGKQVDANVADPAKWNSDFAAAMVKMGNIGVKIKPAVAGVTEIREFCWKVNDRAY